MGENLRKHPFHLSTDVGFFSAVLVMELQTWCIEESQAEEASTHFLVVGFRDFFKKNS